MKRSKTVQVGTTMLALSAGLTACDSVEDQTYSNNYYDNKTRQIYNYVAEKKLRVTCDKPEDFSITECHRKEATASTATGFRGSYGGYSSGYSSYGPNTSRAQSYATARSGFNTSGLTGMVKSQAAPASTFRGFGSFGSTMTARSQAVSISRGGYGSFTLRGGFGATGRGFTAGGSRGSTASG